jgi:hypothetical protein
VLLTAVADVDTPVTSVTEQIVVSWKAERVGSVQVSARRDLVASPQAAPSIGVPGVGVKAGG